MRPSPPLDVLLPAKSRIKPDPDECALRELYAYREPIRSRAFVRATMVSSVDGGAWGPDHRSGTINDDADARVFAVLRCLADVVLVGAGTTRTERYGPLTTTGPLSRHRRAPLRTAVVTASGVVPAALTTGLLPPLVVTTAHGAGTARSAVDAEHLIVVGTALDHDGAHLPAGGVDLTEALAMLAQRGLGRVLCEGGPTLLGALLQADLVDELCLTTTPLVVGAGPGRIVGTSVGAAHLLRAARLDHLLHAAGTTIARWTLAAGPGEHPQ